MTQTSSRARLRKQFFGYKCGEKYYSDEVAEQLESLVNTAKQFMQDIAVIDYSKAA